MAADVCARMDTALPFSGNARVLVVNSLSSLIHDTVFLLKGLKETLIASASDVLCRLYKGYVGLEGHIDVLYLLKGLHCIVLILSA